MASAGSRVDTSWADRAAISHCSPEASSLVFTRDGHTLARDFSDAAAAAAASPSLHDIRARLQDVMRSIDDTILGAETSSLSASPAPLPATTFGSALNPNGDDADADDADEGDCVDEGSLLAARAVREARRAELAALARLPFTSSTAVGLASSARPPPAPAHAAVPSSSRSVSATSSASSSASWPRQTFSNTQKQRQQQQQQPKMMVRERTLDPSALAAQSSISAAARVERASLQALSSATVDSAASSSTSQTGISDTYKATLNYWRAGGHRLQGRARWPQQQHPPPQPSPQTDRAAEVLGEEAEKAEDGLFAHVAASSAVSAVSSQTTASKYQQPISQRSRASLNAAGGLVKGGVYAGVSNTVTDTLTSTCVSATRSSSDVSSTVTDDDSIQQMHRRSPQRGASNAVPDVLKPADTLTTAATTTTKGVARELPPPSSVPSLSARLAVLRSADAAQRASLQQHSGGHGRFAGDLSDTLGDEFSSAPGGAKAASAYRHVDALSGLQGGLGAYAEEKQQLPKHAAEAHAFSPPPPLPGSSPLFSHIIQTPRRTRDIHEERGSGINTSRHSETLVRSPDSARGASPASEQRRVQREVRQDETARLVWLAQQRQEAAEEAWRDSQRRLRPPPSPSSSPSLLRHHPPSAVSGTVNSLRKGGADGAVGYVDEIGMRAGQLTTAPLDALQERLLTFVTADAGDEGGVLPMREELAVRERLAMRRHSGSNTGGGDDDGVNANAHRTVQDDSISFLPPPRRHSPEKAELDIFRAELRRRQQHQQQRQQRQLNKKAEQEAFARRSKARDEDVQRQLEKEVAYQTKVQAEAQARVARVEANVPVSDTPVRLSEEVAAIRMHAAQLDKLRQQMQRDVAPATPSHASPNLPVPSTSSTVAAPPARRPPPQLPASKPAATAPDATSSTSSLNIPEVSPSVPRATSVDYPVQQRKEDNFLLKTTTTAAAASGVKSAAREKTSVTPPTAPSATAAAGTVAAATAAVTALPTASALRSSEVEVEDSEEEQTFVSSVSATSMDDREATPEQTYHHPSSRAQQVSRPTTKRSEAKNTHATQNTRREAIATQTPEEQQQYTPAPAAAPSQLDPSAHHVAFHEDASNDVAVDVESEDTASQHDWQTATQLPPAAQQPRRIAPVPQATTAPPPSPPSSPCVTPPRNRPRDLTNSNNTPLPVQSDEPPSPLPINPAADPARLVSRQEVRGRHPLPRTATTAATASKASRREGGGALDAGGAAAASDASAVTLTAAQTTPASPLRGASLPVVDVERDLISSSPSQGQLGGSPSISPERLAAIRSTRLHVSPERGTAWQRKLQASHAHHDPSHRSRALSSHSASSSLSTSTSSSSPPLSALLLRSAVASRRSPTHARQRTPSPRTPTRAASPQELPASSRPLTPPAAAAPSLVAADDERAAQHQATRAAANAQTAERARAMLSQEGLAVDVQLAGRRLPAVVKLSADGTELLFYLERVAEAEDSDEAAPHREDVRQSATPQHFPQVQQQQQQQRPSSVVSARPPSSSAYSQHTLSPQQSRHARVSPLSSRFVSPPLSPRGSLYSVAPSVHLHRDPTKTGITAASNAAAASAAAAARTGGPLTPPAEVLVPRRGVRGPPPPGFVKVPAGTLLPSHAPTSGTRAAAAAAAAAATTGPAQRVAAPLVARQAAPQPPHAGSSWQPYSASPSPSPQLSRCPSNHSLASSAAHTPRAVHVRERHHFPCRYARLYVPYGVMGHEESCGAGGPHTWEDVSGVLCGPASFEVLRRYGCPLFAHMRGSAYAPYRAYVIIPEFRRIDVPQDAVLLVLDFKQRVDWVLFLLAMQHATSATSRALREGAAEKNEERRLRRADPQEKAASSLASQYPSVLSYGRLLWMLAVQRLQRAHALRGLNPFEARAAARHGDPAARTTSPRLQEVVLLRTAQDGKTVELKEREKVQRAATNASTARASNGAVAVKSPAVQRIGPSVAPPSPQHPQQRPSQPPSSQQQQQYQLLSKEAARRATESAPEFAPETAFGAAAVPTAGAGRFGSPPVTRKPPQPSRVNVVAPPAHHAQISGRAPPPRQQPHPQHQQPSAMPPPSAQLYTAAQQQAAFSEPPRRGLLRGGEAEQQKVGALLHSPPSERASNVDSAHPLYAEESAKPRFRWLHRVASSLNSSRRSITSGRHTSSTDKN